MSTKPAAAALIGPQEPEVDNEPERSRTRARVASRRRAVAVSATVTVGPTLGSIPKKAIGTCAVAVDSTCRRLALTWDTVVIIEESVARGKSLGKFARK